jgi:hypothetical protein
MSADANSGRREMALPNGGKIQDGRQTRMFHNSANFHLNHFSSKSFEILDLQTSIHKIIVVATFFQNFHSNSIQNGVNIQDGDYVFLSVRMSNLNILDSYRRLYMNQ